MNEKERAEAQKVLDLLTEIITITKASGSEEHNHIIGLKLIDRVGCINMAGYRLRDGLFVRPIWSNNPERADGYYDICVEGDSPWGMIIDVIKDLERIF